MVVNVDVCELSVLLHVYHFSCAYAALTILGYNALDDVLFLSFLVVVIVSVKECYGVRILFDVP
ncbi:hypothetical protein D3C78_1861390 [compost metagenome]